VVVGATVVVLAVVDVDSTTGAGDSSADAQLVERAPRTMSALIHRQIRDVSIGQEEAASTRLGVTGLLLGSVST
jgi:hypothetical protein